MNTLKKCALAQLFVIIVPSAIAAAVAPRSVESPATVACKSCTKRIMSCCTGMLKLLSWGAVVSNQYIGYSQHPGCTDTSHVDETVVRLNVK